MPTYEGNWVLFNSVTNDFDVVNIDITDDDIFLSNSQPEGLPYEATYTLNGVTSAFSFDQLGYAHFRVEQASGNDYAPFPIKIIRVGTNDFLLMAQSYNTYSSFPLSTIVQFESLTSFLLYPYAPQFSYSSVGLVVASDDDGSVPTKVRNPPQDLTTFGGLRHGPRVAV